MSDIVKRSYEIVTDDYEFKEVDAGNGTVYRQRVRVGQSKHIVHITVDLDKISHQIAHRACGNRSRRATFMKGAVVAQEA